LFSNSGMSLHLKGEQQDENCVGENPILKSITIKGISISACSILQKVYQ